MPQDSDEEERAHPVLELAPLQIVDALRDGQLTLHELRSAGMEVFTRSAGKAEGFGNGPFDPTEAPSPFPGNCPTLQGNGTTLRLNGLDAQSCNECHTIVSHRTVPPLSAVADSLYKSARSSKRFSR